MLVRKSCSRARARRFYDSINVHLVSIYKEYIELSALVVFLQDTFVL